MKISTNRLLIKNTILFLTIILFTSCSNYLKIVEATKTKHISGIKNGKNYIDYKLKVNAKTDFTYIKIELNNVNIKDNLYYKNLENGLSSTKISEYIKKGKYEFGFRVFNENVYQKEEDIVFWYRIKNKNLKLKSKVVKNDIKLNK